MTTINTEYEAVTSTNIIYNNYIDRWRFLYHSYIGGKEYRDAGYLTRYALETDKEYNARCAETPLDNHCASVISVYNSFLFREEPEREFNSIANLPELEDFLNDADFDGRSLDAFMREVNTWANVFGHSWILMSKPNINAVTRADELANGVRPYVSLISPLTVVDWEWTRSVSGRYELTYLKYIEDVNGDVQTIREWTPELIKTSTVDTNRQEIKEQVIEDNQLGIIPAVLCYSQRGIVRGIGVSSISDIADITRYIYNAYSESAQSIRLDSHPSLVTTPDAQIGTGSGAIIQIPDNLDPGLKPYVLDFAGASIDSILKLIENAAKSIEKIANLGGVRATQSSSMSGVALETEFQLLNAKLATMADNIELAEEQMWRLFCLYQGQPFDVEVEYSDSFNFRDTAREIQELNTAASTSQDPRVQAAIATKVIEWLDIEDEYEEETESEDTEFTPHTMIDPNTGETRTAMTEAEHLELSAQGWIHEGE